MTKRDRFGEPVEAPEPPAITPKTRVLERIAALRRQLDVKSVRRRTVSTRSAIGEPS
jgi:hypothetical protein